MFEHDISLSQLIDLGFVKHHPLMCSVDLGACAEAGADCFDTDAQFLAIDTCVMNVLSLRREEGNAPSRKPRGFRAPPKTRCRTSRSGPAAGRGGADGGGRSKKCPPVESSSSSRRCSQLAGQAGSRAAESA